MISLEEKKLLTDIAIAADSITSYLQSILEFSQYKASKVTRRAVERELEIIGEAVNGLLKINPSPILTNAHRMISLRNRIIHDYDAVNDTIIWKIVTTDLPFLQQQVQQLLAQE